jgi:hypothetical protein
MRDVLQRLACIAALSVLLVGGCGGGDSPPPVDNEVTGTAVMAVIDGATIEVWAIYDTGAFSAAPLGTTTTAADGSFTVNVGSYTGPVLLEATGGNYVDEATGVTKSITTDIPLLGITMAVNGTATGNLTPLTHWAAVLTYTMAAEPNTDADLAMANAVKMVEDYFGVTDLLTTVPADLTAGAVPPGNEAEHAAASAGFSELADDQGYADPVMLVDYIAYDGADVLFDGDERGWPILPSNEMGGPLLRDAIRDFLDNNSRNQSGLGQGDVSVDEAVDAHILPGGDASYVWPPRLGAMDVSGGTTAGGTTVNLFGAGIDTNSGVDVFFDSAAATVVSSSAGAVEVETPPMGEGKVDIEIVNLELRLTTRLLNAFEYYAPGPPTLSRICPAYGPTNGGALIEVYGTRFGPTSTVEIDGMSAPIVQRIHPNLLVARAPAHAAGNVQVLVRTGGTASNGTTFEYRNRDVGQNLTDADYGGNWTLYRLGHDYTGGSSSFAARTTLNFDGMGAIAYSETRRTTSPGDLPGTQLDTNGNYDYASFPDGTLHITLNPAADPENREFLRVWTQDEADVFAGGRIERRYVTEMNVGVRNGTGLSNASLSGKYWMAGLFTQYLDPAGDRYNGSAFGYAEFDGAGAGSLNMLLTNRETGDPGYFREFTPHTFTYTVAANGDFDMVWEDGTILHGTVAAAGDFAAAVEFDSPGLLEGELAMFLFTPQANGVLISSLAGSWYGGDFGAAIEGTNYDEYFYFADRLRTLTDTQGVTLIDTVYNDTWDLFPEGEVVEEPEGVPVFVAPQGYLVGNDDPVQMVGVLGGTRRFLLLAPSWPMGDFGDQDDQMIGMVLRNCAYFSQGSLDQLYNTANLTYEYMSPQSPPVADEEAMNWVGTIDFTPTMPVNLGGMPFLASGRAFAAGGTRKMWKKEPGLGGDSTTVNEPDFDGGYAIAGDGRTYVFAPTDEPGLLDPLLGQTTPHGEAAMLRTSFVPGEPTWHSVLARQTTTAPTPSGDYLLSQFCIGLESGTAQTKSRINRGTVNILTNGNWSGSIDTHERYEDGRAHFNGTAPSSGTSAINADGTITVTPSGGLPLRGMVTPDGSAIFLVDDSPNSLEVCFTVMLRKNAQGTGVNTDGSFSMLALEHEFSNTGLYPPASAAATGQIEAFARTNSAADLGVLVGFRDNEFGTPYVEGGFGAGFVWTVAGDGGLTFATPGTSPETMLGQVSANGRYACVIPGDPTPDNTSKLFFMRR